MLVLTTSAAMAQNLLGNYREDVVTSMKEVNDADTLMSENEACLLYRLNREWPRIVAFEFDDSDICFRQYFAFAKKYQKQVIEMLNAKSIASSKTKWDYSNEYINYSAMLVRDEEDPKLFLVIMQLTSFNTEYE